MVPLALTPGEPAGIGPDLVLSLSQSPASYPFVAVADRDMLERRASHLGVSVKLRAWEGQPVSQTAAGELWVKHVPLAQTEQPGVLNSANAPYVLKTLDAAIEGSLAGQFQGLVTGPVHKGVVNDAGIVFSGHTEYLQEKCGVERVVMMLATPGLRVALVTTHLPLKDVAAAITKSRLTQVLDILLAELKHKFGVDQARVLVAGLNPHAGEGGHMGREEIEVISPALEAYRQAGHLIEGPLPADTLFTDKYLRHADAVLAMYHDQGLPVLKFQGFGQAVNITLGLPIIRTSVDHGTALDLAGTGQADAGSLKCAIEQAAMMANVQRWRDGEKT